MPQLSTRGAASARGFGFAGIKLGDPPVNTAAPTITGSYLVNGTLYLTNNGTWTGATTYSYEWRRNGSPISGATSSTYVVTASDIGAVLTCAVVARGVKTKPGTAISNPTTIIPSLGIGDSYQGGYVAAQYSLAGNGVADYWLVVAPKSTGESNQYWGLGDKWVDYGANSWSDGVANSNVTNTSQFPATYFCKTRTIGGYTDWYSPATYELLAAFFNLKPYSNLNSVWNDGANLYSVPTRNFNTTSTIPLQTNATDFKNTGANYFIGTLYWTSAQYSPSGPSAAVIDFYQSRVNAVSKQGDLGYVRAFRRVAVATPTLTTAPVLTGSAVVGGTLSCSQGAWGNSPTSYTYQWLRNGIVISGATGTSYTLPASAAGTTISCRVTATNASGNAFSSPSIAVP